MKKYFCWLRTMHENLEMAMFASVELQKLMLQKNTEFTAVSHSVTVMLIQKPMALQPTMLFYVVVLCHSSKKILDPSNGKEVENGGLVMGQAADAGKKFDA